MMRRRFVNICDVGVAYPLLRVEKKGGEQGKKES
jgi:hypothetical protein